MARIYFGISDVDREDVGLLSKVRAGKVQAAMLGDLARGKARSYPGSERHATPKGCQWARSCDDCLFKDCVIRNESELFAYDSAKGRAARKAAKGMRHGEMARLRMQGLGVAGIALQFGVHIRTVERALAIELGASEKGRHRQAQLCKDLPGPPLPNQNVCSREGTSVP